MTYQVWDLGTASLLAAGALTHAAVATLTTTAGELIPAPIIDGTLTYDEERSPRVELTLTTHLNPDPALLSRIDPRLGTRLLLSVGYDRPDGILDLQPVANLGLRSRTRNRPDDTLELVARSDEALLIDNGPSTALNIAQPTTVAAIGYVIGLGIPTPTIVATATNAGPAISFNEPDVDKWDTVADLADRISAVVYDDGLRTWRITDRPNNPAISPDHTLADGPGGTLVSVVDSIDRDAGFGNRVMVVYEWTDTAGTAQRQMAVADAQGAYTPTPGNTATIREPRTVPTAPSGATSTATALAARTVTRGRSFTLTAPSAYWLRPADTVAVKEAGRDLEYHLITAISFDLKAGLMSITTRQPTQPTGRWDDQDSLLSWDAVPAAQTWDTFTGG